MRVIEGSLFSTAHPLIISYGLTSFGTKIGKNFRRNLVLAENKKLRKAQQEQARTIRQELEIKQKLQEDLKLFSQVKKQHRKRFNFFLIVIDVIEFWKLTISECLYKLQQLTGQVSKQQEGEY